MPIRLIAIEDDPQFRSSLATLLCPADDLELVDTFGSPAEVLAALRRHPRPGWDVVLTELVLPGMGGVECIRRIRRGLPGATIVVLTTLDDRVTILEAIRAGADGYLLKRMPAPELLAQLRSIPDGGAPIAAGVARTILDLVRDVGPDPVEKPHAPGPLELTERERDILRCLVRGMSYKRAARHLDISIDTVRSHIRSIYSKLEVHSGAAAVSRALRDGIL